MFAVIYFVRIYFVRTYFGGSLEKSQKLEPAKISYHMVFQGNLTQKNGGKNKQSMGGI